MMDDVTRKEQVRLLVGDQRITADLSIPLGARAIILFAHGSGSRRLSLRNRFVAERLNRDGFATLMIDLLSENEDYVDQRTGQFRFDIWLLARRLEFAIDWLRLKFETRNLKIGLFGASTGSAAAIVAAARRADLVGAVVSRGGRPDLAGQSLMALKAPVLLIVGGNDVPVIELNREAMKEIQCKAKMEIVPGATHLFEEPGALEKVAELASEWFTLYLTPPNARDIVYAGIA